MWDWRVQLVTKLRFRMKQIKNIHQIKDGKVEECIQISSSDTQTEKNLATSEVSARAGSIVT